MPFCQIMPKNLLAQSIRAQHSEMMELALDTPRSRRVTAWIRVIETVYPLDFVAKVVTSGFSV